MKKTIIRFAFPAMAFIIITALSGATGRNKKETKPFLSYYWFYTNNVWNGHYHSPETEMSETGLTTSTVQPCTLVLKGFLSSSVTYNPPTFPYPNNPGSPDIQLYSRP